MRCVAEPRRSLPWCRPVLFAGIALITVGCSSEATRFTENPFAARSPAKDATASAPVKSRVVQSLPLPPTRPAVSSTSTASQLVPSYQTAPASEVTGSVRRPASTVQSAPQGNARSGWNWEGGTPVTVAIGETAETLAHRYGVPVRAILQANNLSSASAVRPGQRLVIPRYDASLTTGSVKPQPAAQNVPVRPAGNGQIVHTVAPGETLMMLSRQYKKTLSEIARANNIAPQTMVKVGDRIVIPGVRAQQTAFAPAAAAPQPVATQRPAALAPATKVASADSAPIPAARAIAPVNEETAALKPEPVPNSMPTFRWPVRGRVIAGFGPKPTGQQNDGINVSVPEGTPIRAAEDGVVAYAGNELKTYGNLVLIRHSNGYVTAYAHASEILVKRDEPVKRGQVIAKSGQTGNVSSPQVHFEIRKGSSPVDPTPHLDRGA